jgi:hypothetical protein
MKTIVNNYNYSLNNNSNFKKKIYYTTNNAIDKYIKLIFEYIIYILDNLKNNNNDYYEFITIRGLDTIHHVYHLLLLYTNNIDITYFHVQKAIYFYIEFIQQISTEENIFLQLTSRDATMYVYRKTIFEINNDFRKNTTKDGKDKLEIIIVSTNIIKSIFLNIILQNKNLEKNKIMSEYLNDFEKIGEYIYLIKEIETLKIIENFVLDINLIKCSFKTYLFTINLVLKYLIDNKTKINIFLEKINNENWKKILLQDNKILIQNYLI